MTTTLPATRRIATSSTSTESVSRRKPAAESPNGEASSGCAIEFSGVCKQFGTHAALNGLSFEVRAGEIFALVGTNGAGKTTCIKSVLDLCHIDEGRIEIFGRPATDPASRSGLGYLPERFRPSGHLRGREFLRFMATLHGAAPDASRVRTVCNALDLDPAALDKPAGACSKGTAQKLGLAACLLADKSLLLFDEPMSGLDPKARMRAVRLLANARARGTTVFFSTHLLAEAGELCDRMGVLHDGAIRFVGSPARLMTCFPSDSLEESWLACIA